ncbi:hypothetical protein GQ600_857 [Phytophthora cactorum]|nr:hypothetical protein GQ600_857 [Phytophthora cactorum]
MHRPKTSQWGLTQALRWTSPIKARAFSSHNSLVHCWTLPRTRERNDLQIVIEVAVAILNEAIEDKLESSLVPLVLERTRKSVDSGASMRAASTNEHAGNAAVGLHALATFTAPMQFAT